MDNEYVEETPKKTKNFFGIGKFNKVLPWDFLSVGVGTISLKEKRRTRVEFVHYLSPITCKDNRDGFTNVETFR
jgi:hypothetical protein